MRKTKRLRSKYLLNDVQAKNAAKYFLDLSKITFTLLVIGILATEKWLALQSGMWYSGVVITFVAFLSAMYLYRRRK